MPRKLNKGDRLARIKTAASYPTAKEAIAARLVTMDAQSIKRPIDVESLPVAIEAPKHLSSAYRRAIRRYVSRISEQADIWQSELSRMLRSAKRVPILAYRLNPVYYRVVNLRPHRNIGPLMPDYTSSTNSRMTVPPVQLSPSATNKALNILRAVPSDTISPERRAEREWAEYILDTPARIERGRQMSHEIAMTRQQEQRAAVRIIAENIRNERDQSLINTCRSAVPLTYATRPCQDGIGKEVYTIPATIPTRPAAIPHTPSTRQGWLTNRRIPLHTLVPLAAK